MGSGRCLLLPVAATRTNAFVTTLGRAHAMTFSPPAQPTSPAANLPGWRATGRRLADTRSAIPVSLDLDQPRQGICIEASGAAAPDGLLALDLRSEYRLADHWLRGDDVTAVYELAGKPAGELAAAHHLRTTAMWRLHPAASGTSAWQLIVSSQTSQLQCDASLVVSSEIAGTDILWGICLDGGVHWQLDPSPKANCLLLRRGGSSSADGGSVLVAAHPGECRRVSARQECGRTTVECSLFSPALEKGVLLRSRMLAAIGPATDDTEWAGQLAAAFAASPPMLTT